MLQEEGRTTLGRARVVRESILGEYYKKCWGNHGKANRDQPAPLAYITEDTEKSSGKWYFLPYQNKLSSDRLKKNLLDSSNRLKEEEPVLVIG